MVVNPGLIGSLIQMKCSSPAVPSNRRQVHLDLRVRLATTRLQFELRLAKPTESSRPMPESASSTCH